MSELLIQGDELLEELLQGDAWVSTGALFQRSSFESKEKFSEWLQLLKNKKQLQIRTGAFGLEVGLPGTPAPSAERPDAKPPIAPAGAGPMPPPLTAPAPMLEGPARIHGKPNDTAPRPCFVVPSPETEGQLRSESDREAAEEDPPAPVAPAPAETSEAANHTQSAPPARAEDETMPKKAPKTPEEQRELIQGLLRQSAWKTGELIQATGLERNQLYPILKKMQSDGEVKLEGTARAATWSIPGGGKPGAIAAVDQARKAARKNGAGAPGVRNAAPPATITAALDQLAQRIRPRPVERLELKLTVIDRLASIVDPTIAAVLAEIRVDLAPAT